MIHNRYIGERVYVWAPRQSPGGGGPEAEGVFTKQTHFGKTNPFSQPDRWSGRSASERHGRLGFVGGHGSGAFDTGRAERLVAAARDLGNVHSRGDFFHYITRQAEQATNIVQVHGSSLFGNESRTVPREVEAEPVFTAFAFRGNEQEPDSPREHRALYKRKVYFSVVFFRFVLACLRTRGYNKLVIRGRPYVPS